MKHIGMVLAYNPSLHVTKVTKLCSQEAKWLSGHAAVLMAPCAGTVTQITHL